MEEIIISVNIHYLLFLKDIHETLALKDADEEQSKLVNELKAINKNKKSVEKKEKREKFLMNLKAKYFQ